MKDELSYSQGSRNSSIMLGTVNMDVYSGLLRSDHVSVVKDSILLAWYCFRNMAHLL
jgi:hypothetical protein